MRVIVIIMMLVLFMTGCNKQKENNSLDNTTGATDFAENVDNQSKIEGQSGLKDQNSIKDPSSIKDQNSVKDQIDHEEQNKNLASDTIKEIDLINELLAKSSKGVNNVIASLFGLSELLENVNEISIKAIDNSEEAKKVISDCGDNDKLSTFYDAIQDYDNQLTEKKELVKTAKKEQNIVQLEQELNDLYELIKEYNQYIMEVG